MHVAGALRPSCRFFLPRAGRKNWVWLSAHERLRRVRALPPIYLHGDYVRALVSPALVSGPTDRVGGVLVTRDPGMVA